MNKNFIYGLVVGLGALALFGFKSVVERPAGAGVTKWEYMSITQMPGLNIKQTTFKVCGPDGPCQLRELKEEGHQTAELLLLNEFGAQGWELLTKNNPIPNSVVNPNHNVFQPMYLKRPIQE